MTRWTCGNLQCGALAKEVLEQIDKGSISATTIGDLADMYLRLNEAIINQKVLPFWWEPLDDEYLEYLQQV